MTQRRKWRVFKRVSGKKNILKRLFLQKTVFACAFLFLCFFTCVGCSNSAANPIIIWTSSAEFASYVELFNSTHENAKAVVVYKEQPARSLPPAKGEQVPDIVVGSWLKNSGTRKYFSPVDYLFSEQKINKALFYPQLIDYGEINGKQYLLPVSFNLPAIVFNSKNSSYVINEHLLNLDDIKTAAGSFNVKNKDGVYTEMGYAPSWDSNFLYLVAKLQGASFREKGTSFSWDSKAMLSAITYLREWTAARNTDTTSEQNFQFKYLYMPEYKQVSLGKSLFAYMSSNELFSLADEQQSGLSFRWIAQDGTVPVDDEIITMGLYKGSHNTSDAEVFLAWFNKEATQEALLKHTADMHLDNKTFGIAGGFSALKNVNEKVYPIYYRQVLGNLPSADFLSTPNILPYRWTSLKQKVIIPYLSASTNTNTHTVVQTLEERIADWSKQYF